jgi:hypothetical protein
MIDNEIRGGKGAYRAIVLDIAVFFVELDDARVGTRGPCDFEVRR